MASFGSFGAQPAPPNHNPNKDVEVTAPPDDGISSLSFSPTANLLVATSWDNQVTLHTGGRLLCSDRRARSATMLACLWQVRCWEIQPNGTSTPKAAHSHDQPVLCSAWNADGSSVFSGGCDKTVKLWNLATNQQQVCSGFR